MPDDSAWALAWWVKSLPIAPPWTVALATGGLALVCVPFLVIPHPHVLSSALRPVPSPTLSPTDPMPRGLLTLCPGAY